MYRTTLDHTITARLRRTSLAVAVPVAFAATTFAQQVDAPSAELPPDVEVRTFELPLGGHTIEQRKWIDPATGTIRVMETDAKDREVDLGLLLRKEVELRSSRPEAKIEPDLAEALEAQPETCQEVVIWLDYDSEAIDREALRIERLAPDGVDPEVAALAEEELSGFVRELIGATNAEALAEVQAVGVDVRYVSTTAPAIFIDADADQVQQLSMLPVVDTLYLESKDAQDLDISSNATHRATQVIDLGFRGYGARVAVLENNGIEPDCPHLDVVGWFNQSSPNPDDHVHATAGGIASQLASRPGAAPDVWLFSANAASYSDTNIAQAADWIVTRSIDVTNMSFGRDHQGRLTFRDRYFDFQSRVYQDSYVAAAGNTGANVTSPGSSWNCVTVGAFDDRNTNGWADDRVSSFSSWIDPHSRCEKPNLAAVGERASVLGMSPDWLRGISSGTSHSAPRVSAAIAVAQRADSSANASPEAAMAASMATAWHNVEGFRALSEIDGAGGLHHRALWNAARSNKIRYFTVRRADVTFPSYYTYNIHLQGGDRAKIAIAWGANANASYTTSVLNADLDFMVFRGANQTSGVIQARSYSSSNNYEIVEFTPPTTGTYTVRISAARFNGSSERVGLAWSQLNADAGN